MHMHWGTCYAHAFVYLLCTWVCVPDTHMSLCPCYIHVFVSLLCTCIGVPVIMHMRLCPCYAHTFVSLLYTCVCVPVVYTRLCTCYALCIDTDGALCTHSTGNKWRSVSPCLHTALYAWMWYEWRHVLVWMTQATVSHAPCACIRWSLKEVMEKRSQPL
jgi:hypothetical protein